MKWIKPDINSQELALPEINNNPQEIDQIKKAPANLVIKINDEFKTIWFNGSEDQTAKALVEAILVLTKTFAEFVRIGQGKVGYDFKSSPGDYVTEVDKGIEMLFRIWLNKFFPKHKIIGEEGFKDEITKDDFVWYIDPLDGTTNFVNGKKDIGLNIGCLHKGKPYLAVVGNPFFNTYYFGDCDDKKVYREILGKRTEIKRLEVKKEPFVVGTEYKKDNFISDKHFENILEKLSAEKFRVKSIALNLVALIEGRITAFYREDVKLWDIIAPLILQSFLRDDYQYLLFFYGGKMQNSEDIFSNDEALIKMINRKNKTDQKMGIFMAVPKNDPQILEAITDEFRKKY